MNYITQADVENYLGVTLTPAGINTFNLLLPLLQDQIDNYCNRTWNITNPIVENFDALSQVGVGVQSNYTFFVKYPSISATPANNAYPLAGGVISVLIGQSPLDLNYVVNYGTHIKLSAAFPSVILANPLGFKMVQITYNSDAAGNPPKALKLAFVMWIARMIQEAPDAGKSTTQVQAGTVRVYYSPDKLAIPKFVESILDNYRLHVLDRL